MEGLLCDQMFLYLLAQSLCYDCDTPDLVLKMIDRLLISTRYIFFLGSPFVKNCTVKRAWWRAILEWVTSWEVFPVAHEWGQSAVERLVLICGASLQSPWILPAVRGAEVLQWPLLWMFIWPPRGWADSNSLSQKVHV